ncbi:MAG TPA: c-type cytochrome [Thermoanaerobaculia bacterium]|nr:c-type cytochrome [Thermoanaerobaculia bacterium]
MDLQPHERVLAAFFRLCVLSALGILFLGAAALFAAWRVGLADEPPPGYLGSVNRGRVLVSRYGCTACHVITKEDVKGLVGPPLTGFANRSYIAGRFPNEPIDMQQWLQHPQAMKPGTSMPDLGVTQRDAGDIAAYLATLH